MKSKLILIAISLFITSFTFSQGVHFGLKAGAAIDKITGKSFSQQFAFGYQVGAFVDIKASKKLGVQGEVLFNQVNHDTSSSFSSVYQFNHIDKIKLSYLSIPILLNYNIDKYITFQVGPQFSTLINQNVSLLQNGQDAFKKGDVAGVVGLQVKIIKFNFYGRYVFGLNNLDNAGSSDSWKNQSIQLGVGFYLF